MRTTVRLDPGLLERARRLAEARSTKLVLARRQKPAAKPRVILPVSGLLDRMEGRR